MLQNIFKIRRAFLIPFLAIIFLLFLLLLLSIFKGRMREGVILSVFFIAVLFIGIEMSRREIVLTEDSLIIKKFFRVKEFVWAEITHLGIVELRKKIYILLTTTKGFYFFSNLVEKHALLIRALVDKLGEEKVEPEVENYLKRPVERFSLIVMSWISVVVIIAIIILVAVSLN